MGRIVLEVKRRIAGEASRSPAAIKNGPGGNVLRGHCAGLNPSPPRAIHWIVSPPCWKSTKPGCAGLKEILQFWAKNHYLAPVCLRSFLRFPPHRIIFLLMDRRPQDHRLLTPDLCLPENLMPSHIAIIYNNVYTVLPDGNPMGWLTTTLRGNLGVRGAPQVYISTGHGISWGGRKHIAGTLFDLKREEVSK